MLDTKYVCEHLEEVIKKLNTRNGDYSYLRELPQLEEKRKNCIVKGETLKAERNTMSKQIGALKAAHKNDEAAALLKTISVDKDEMAKLDKELAETDDAIHEMMLKTPNIPDDSLPIGTDDSFNKPVKYWGKPTTFSFKPSSHWEIGQKLG
ncbi:MAG: serine--tRNA ligase, partial [Bacilli bacterium]